eukprot:2831018-Rhodomonas_salina.4
MSGTDTASDVICLRTCYVMSGTDTASDAICLRTCLLSLTLCPVLTLCVLCCYAVSVTDIRAGWYQGLPRVQRRLCTE